MDEIIVGVDGSDGCALPCDGQRARPKPEVPDAGRSPRGSTRPTR